MQTLKKCPRPKVYEYRTLNPAEHVGSPDNIERLTGNVNSLDSYSREQSATIDCYEAQAGK
ncbi:hypothetical protein [Maridesulfovibrio ferrireducens]|uniref:hypothetical protein n=1 Tax=Maridesulfovibrio ferrireducens TaxID=246191 RepID=UPI001A343E8F|nr:hypothetical protein [Maridesulfovibrio ferrireducens]MBI9109999.1 hypothetical protein [Maridesulfovibrio ferrireducens]